MRSTMNSKNNKPDIKRLFADSNKFKCMSLVMAVALLGGCGSSSNSLSGSSEDTSDGSNTSTLIEGNTLVINEIVAKDSSGGSDWIELYVTEGTVNLADYSLIDDNEGDEPQSLPALTLSAGEYVIINAIDEDDASSQDGYYVTFKLGSSDSVSLYKGNALADFVGWNKGEALSGFSFGRYVNGTGSLQTLSPTMGSDNIQADRGPLIINEIVNKDASGGADWFELYNAGNETIDISNYTIVDDTDDLEEIALPNASLAAGGFVVIYATEDDTSELSVPFKLGSSDSLTLKLNDVTVDYLEWDDSDAPEGYSYGSYPDGSWKARTLEVTQAFSNTDAVTFETNVVENIYVTIENSLWQDLVDSALEKEEYSVSVTYKGVTLEEVSFRTKGNSTLSQVAATDSERFSFKIDTNEYVSGQKLLNLKKLNLNNGYNDPTYMRETISYNIMRNLDLPAPKTSYVNVYINDVLHGLYTMVEQVDGEFLERNFTDPDGDLYKPDDADNEGLVGHDLIWIDDSFASYTSIELKTNEDVTDNSAMISFLNEINNGSNYDLVMDTDSMLRYLAASTVMGNLDSYQGILAHNYYLYEESGQFSIIPWDLNESFGTFSMGCGDVSGLYIDEPTQGALSERPLIAALLSSEENLNTYHDYITQLVEGDLNPNSLEKTINDIADLIRSDVQSDPTAFYTPAEFETGLTSEVGQTPGLLSFVTDRAISVTNQLDSSAPSSGDGSGFCTGSGAQLGGPGGGPPMM